MPKTIHDPQEFRCQMVELLRVGRTPEEFARRYGIRSYILTFFKFPRRKKGVRS